MPRRQHPGAMAELQHTVASWSCGEPTRQECQVGLALIVRAFFLPDRRYIVDDALRWAVTPTLALFAPFATAPALSAFRVALDMWQQTQERFGEHGTNPLIA